MFDSSRWRLWDDTLLFLSAALHASASAGLPFGTKTLRTAAERDNHLLERGLSVFPLWMQPPPVVHSCYYTLSQNTRKSLCTHRHPRVPSVVRDAKAVQLPRLLGEAMGLDLLQVGSVYRVHPPTLAPSIRTKPAGRCFPDP